MQAFIGSSSNRGLIYLWPHTHSLSCGGSEWSPSSCVCWSFPERLNMCGLQPQRRISSIPLSVLILSYFSVVSLILSHNSSSPRTASETAVFGFFWLVIYNSLAFCFFRFWTSPGMVVGADLYAEWNLSWLWCYWHTTGNFRKSRAVPVRLGWWCYANSCVKCIWSEYDLTENEFKNISKIILFLKMYCIILKITG